MIEPGTPLPWKACRDGDCTCGMIWSLPADFHIITVRQKWGDHADDGFPDAEMPLECMQQNARYVAHACNAYPALVDQAEELATALDGALRIISSWKGWQWLGEDKATAALAAYRSAKP